jgi:hypothetical protein
MCRRVEIRGSLVGAVPIGFETSGFVTSSGNALSHKFLEADGSRDLAARHRQT